MASVVEGSFPLLLQIKKHWRSRPNSSLASIKPRNSRVDLVCLDSANGSLQFRYGSFVLGSRRKRLRRVGVTGSEASEGGGDEGEQEDTVQATIEKSKKVLDMQRDLLQQIAERRKLVSSIKDSVPVMEEDEEEGGNNGEDASIKTKGEWKDSKKETETIMPSSNIISNGSLKKNKLRSSIASPLYKPSSSKKLQSGVISPEKTSPARDVQLDPLPSFLIRTSEDSGETRQEQLDESGNETRQPEEEEVKPPPMAGANAMNVILVAAECAPFSKTGGLGDVAGSLPKALARRGHRVMVVVPRYAEYSEARDTGIRKRYKVDGQDMEVLYFQTFIDGVDFVFLDSPVFRHLGNNIYGGNRVDILRRMVLFCKAAVEVPWYVPCGGVCYGDGNLVFIANDWHTALLPVYLKAYYRDHGIMKYTRSVLVIHNIAHQGRGPLDDFSYVDVPESYMESFKIYDPVGGDHLNIFAAGLKAADRIVTVSNGYAWEVKTSEGGWGLHNLIKENDWKFRGIVNGIDSKEWNPRSDVHLGCDGYMNYSLETLETGKARCKEALQKELGLEVRPDVPLIGFIGRLDHQKGVDLIAEAVPWMMSQDIQLVLLGTGRADLEQVLRQLESEYRDKARGWVGFSVRTAHRITAGADVLLMPSRFEPCGLNQLYAMSYGTVPVVHAVGGLRDTVQPFDPYNETGLGWTFERAEAGRLIEALGNCLVTYREYKKSWRGLQRRGMMQDLSWDSAAENYEHVLLAAKFQW